MSAPAPEPDFIVQMTAYKAYKAAGSKPPTGSTPLYESVCVETVRQFVTLFRRWYGSECDYGDACPSFVFAMTHRDGVDESAIAMVAYASFSNYYYELPELFSYCTPPSELAILKLYPEDILQKWAKVLTQNQPHTILYLIKTVRAFLDARDKHNFLVFGAAAKFSARFEEQHLTRLIGSFVSSKIDGKTAVCVTPKAA